VKLAIIGGAGVRVPLLVNGLIGRGLPFREIALFDPDRARLDVIARLAAARAGGATITIADEIGGCVAAADFVVTSIRVGGLRTREHDETVSIAHGVVGQETVGPGGFAMGVRTARVLTGYARIIAERAPDAWIVNFSNPVGLVTQAMHRAAPGLKIAGICDTPTELFAEIAHALHVPVGECSFDYVGLNHLGWVRDVRRDGHSLLEGAWEDRALLARIYSRPLFPPDYLAGLKLLPTEYVYYYAFPDRAAANIRAAGTSRGTVVRELTDRLFADLAAPPADPVTTYEQYIAARSASYMQIESGQASPKPPSPWAELTGYDRIAFDVMHAIVNDTGAVIPLNVRNDSNIPELAPDDVIEVPCEVRAGGLRPRPVGLLPSQVRDLVLEVKQYERLTIGAAETMANDALVNALAANPLVPSRNLAATLVTELRLQ
jgi:6-phospho-beta-glucosidase